MLQIQDLTKCFEEKEVVKNVNLNVNKGSIYGLLGSNGAGKTTILRIITGILKQNEGTVLVDEQPIFENNAKKEQLIFIPDHPYFFSHYTVKQMAEFHQSFYPNWNEERFMRLQQIFKLDLNSKIQRFSKGMQRQVSFWLALSAMPDYLILDEPFDGLDVVIRKKVKNLIINDVAEREMTVIISSHNLREVEDICDHIGILHNGEFVLEKDLDDLKSDVHKVQVAFEKEFPEELFETFDILHQEARGTVHLLIIKGQKDDIDAKILKHLPLIYDVLPLTLEEVFVYEMEGIGYAIENILV